MQPIRGPIDYNRYPPRARRNSAARADELTPDASTHHEVTAEVPDTGEASVDPQRRNRSAHRRRAADASFGNPGQVTQNSAQDAARRRVADRRAARRVAAPRSRARHAAPPHGGSTGEDFAEEHNQASQPQVRKGGRGSRRPPKNRAPLWKRVRRWCGILLIIFCFEFAIALLTAPHFSIERVEVEGLAITSPQDVVGVQSALVGQNWLRAGLRSAVATLEKLPTVREARITRDFRWPPQVTVHIEERQPFARVGAGDDWWIVDGSGMPFRRANLREPKDVALYAVTGPTLQPQIGKFLPAKYWQPVREFALSLSQAQEKGTRWSLRRLYFDRHGFASLRLTGGAHDEMLIQMGADRWSKKLQRARQALTYFEATGRRAAVLNLISYSMPTWTPRPEEKTDADAAAAAPANAATARNTVSGGASTRPVVSEGNSTAPLRATAT